MKIEYFREFLALARNMNFGKTASELFITQSNLTRHIQAIEKEVGATLINRSKDSAILLTPAGNLFLHDATRILHIYEKTIVGCRELRNQTQRELRIMECSLYDAYAAVFRLGYQFGKEFSDVRVTFMPPSRQVSEAAVSADVIDVAFVFHSGNIEEIVADCSGRGMIAIPIAESEPLGVWMHDDNPLARKTEITLEDFEDVPVLFNLSRNLDPIGSGVKEMLRKANIIPKIDMRSAFNDTEFYAQEPGAGVYIIPMHLASDSRIVMRDDMVLRPLFNEGCRLIPFLIAKRESDNTAVRDFIEYVAKNPPYADDQTL